jgi:hypothetical protein
LTEAGVTGLVDLVMGGHSEPKSAGYIPGILK